MRERPTVKRFPFSGIDHCFTRGVKLKLYTLILLPLVGDVNSDFEPVISPTRSKGIAFLSGLVDLALGLFESRLCMTRGRPNFERHVLFVVEAMSEEQCSEVVLSVMATL